MHVALISPYWPIGVPSGIVTYVDHLRYGLIRLGHRVSVLAFDVGPTLDTAGVYRISADPITRNYRHLLRFLSFGRINGDQGALMIADTVNRIHRSQPIDVIEMEESFGWCELVQKAVPIPVVVKLHGPAFLSEFDGDLPAPQAQAKAQSEGRALRAVAAIVAPTTATLRDTLAHYGLEPPVARQVFNPVRPIEDEELMWRLALGEPKTLVFVGRFDRRKGADNILAVFNLIAQARSDVNLVLIGPDKGICESGGQRLFFAEYVARHFPSEVARRVKFLGSLPAADVQRWRARCACVLIASRRESYGYAVAEALAQGCPVVAFDVPGVNELIHDEHTGLLAPLDDVAGMAQRVLCLLDDPGKASRLSVEGRREMLGPHSPASVAAAMVDTYEAAIAAFRARTEP